ncbi:MAG: hypothetical protein HZC55_08235 [Verrucomicrobia bacterium]|nr:hypothetical protein [Verrucomicrobiota bacterium]
MRLFPLYLALATALSAAQPYRVGDTFAAFSTKDQHDKPYSYAGGARLVVVAFDMSSGKAANAFFEKQPADFLGAQQAIFISNIHGMPGIARAFAMPKMKKYPHRILLADSEDFLVRYPKKEDHLTVLDLDPKGAVTGIRFVDPKKGLPAVFPGAK